MITKFKIFEEKLCGYSNKEPKVKEPKTSDPTVKEPLAQDATLKKKKKIKTS